MKTPLTPAQHAILDHAHNHTDGKIAWFPDNIKGGARKKVLDGMFNRALITLFNGDWFIAAEGYDVLGVPRKGAVTAKVLDEVIASAEQAQDRPIKTPRTRDNSKQARVIALLKRPEGATIAQIMDATGWLSHTIRGTFAGVFKKKLGLDITSGKDMGTERVYKIAD